MLNIHCVLSIHVVLYVCRLNSNCDFLGFNVKQEIIMLTLLQNQNFFILFFFIYHFIYCIYLTPILYTYTHTMLHLSPSLHIPSNTHLPILSSYIFITARPQHGTTYVSNLEHSWRWISGKEDQSL